MHNHFWKNRDRKMLSISIFKLELNLHHTRDDLGQTAATKLVAATGSVLSVDQQTVILFRPFQLLVAMAAHPSRWILLRSELQTNYLC